MKNRLTILLLLALIIVVTIPVSAILTPNTGAGTNITFYNSSAYFHDANYALIEIEYLFIAIGFLTILASRTLQSGKELFAIVSPIAFGIAAWYANYMTKESVEGLALGTNGFMLHTEFVVASPVLSIVMVACFLISILNILDIFFFSHRLTSEREPDTSEE